MSARRATGIVVRVYNPRILLVCGVAAASLFTVSLSKPLVAADIIFLPLFSEVYLVNTYILLSTLSLGLLAPYPQLGKKHKIQKHYKNLLLVTEIRKGICRANWWHRHYRNSKWSIQRDTHLTSYRDPFFQVQPLLFLFLGAWAGKSRHVIHSLAEKNEEEITRTCLSWGPAGK